MRVDLQPSLQLKSFLVRPCSASWWMKCFPLPLPKALCPLASIYSECLFEVVFSHRILQIDQHLLGSLCWSPPCVLCKNRMSILRSSLPYLQFMYPFSFVSKMLTLWLSLPVMLCCAWVKYSERDSLCNCTFSSFFEVSPFLFLWKFRMLANLHGFLRKLILQTFLFTTLRWCTCKPSMHERMSERGLRSFSLLSSLLFSSSRL